MTNHMTFTGAFSWRGGKSKLTSQILPFFPKHDCYVEPFFGSGAMFFAQAQKAKVSCVNDLNSEIANFFRVVREKYEAFCERLPLYPHARDDFNHLKSLDPTELPELERALRFYIVQTGSFSGGGTSFAAHGPSKANPTVQSKINNIMRIAKQLDGVTIENSPFEYIIALYDRAETFFYMDPPYFETGGYQGVGTFHVSNYGLIADFMKNQKGKTALSINDHPHIRELFKEFPMVEFPIKYSCKKGETTPRSELLIMNYTREETRLLL